MEKILSDYSTSISELKKNPGAVIAEAHGETVAVLNRNTPTAYLVSPQEYEFLLEALDELDLIHTVEQRRKDEDKAVEVKLDDL